MRSTHQDLTCIYQDLVWIHRNLRCLYQDLVNRFLLTKVVVCNLLAQRCRRDLQKPGRPGYIPAGRPKRLLDM